MRCMAAFLALHLCVCMSVRVQDNSKNIEPINFIFGGGLPSDTGRKLFDLKKNRPAVRVGMGGAKFGPNVIGKMFLSGYNS